MALDTSGRTQLSPKMMEAFREQRKLRRQQIGKDVAAAAGASAESFRTGAPTTGVFDRWKPDYSDQMMSKREKMKRSQGIYEKQQRDETARHGNALQVASNRARTLAQNRTAQQQRAMDTARRIDTATVNRVREKIRAQNNTVSNNNIQRELLEKPSDGAQAYFADMPTYEQRLDTEARLQYELLQEADPGYAAELENKHGSEKGVIAALRESPVTKEVATDKAKKDAKHRIERMSEGNPEDKDLVWAVNEASKKSNASPAEIHDSLDPSARARTRDAEIQHAADLENINDENEVIDGKFEREYIQMGDGQEGGEQGARFEEGRTPGSAEREAGKIGASRLEEIKDVDPTASDVVARDYGYEEQDKALAAEVGEKVAAIGVDGQPVEEQGFLGTDVKQPKPGARAHFRALLEVIERFPESKPAQHAKQEIMKTQEFKDYQAKHFQGVEGGDSQIVWKEMVRDWRKQNQEKNQLLRKARVAKRSKEKTEAVASLSRPLRPKPPPVQGSSPATEPTTDSPIV